VNNAFFVDKEVPPDPAKLKQALRQLYPAYKEIRELTEACNHEWKYYGRKIGWQLKAIQKEKALFYLTPLEQSFRISFAVREGKREHLLDSNVSSTAKE
jgi:hypothetical protein